MNKPLNYKDIVNIYFEKFGKEPEVTGGSFFESGDIMDKLIDSINTGIEFKDKKVPDGALI